MNTRAAAIEKRFLIRTFHTAVIVEAIESLRDQPGGITETKKREIRVVVAKFRQFLDGRSFENILAKLDGEDILDVTPIAHEIADRILEDFARLTDRRPTPLSDAEKVWLKAGRIEWFLGLCETLATTQTDRTRLRKLRRSYEKSRGISLSTTRKGRATVSFLEKYCERSTIRGIILELTPVLEAFNENDAGFFENFATAMRFRESCKRETVIARARRARRAITEAAILQGTKESMTWREAQQKFWPEYKGDPKDFRDILNECGFAWKRGKHGRPPKNRGMKKTGSSPY